MSTAAAIVREYQRSKGPDHGFPKANWAKVPNQYIDHLFLCLTKGELGVLATILKGAYREEGECSFTNADFRENTGLCERAVTRCLARLRELKLIDWRGDPGKRNVYRPLVENFAAAPELPQGEDEANIGADTTDNKGLTPAMNAGGLSVRDFIVFGRNGTTPRIHHGGQVLPNYAGANPIFALAQPAAAPARCGVCKQVGILDLIPADQLEDENGAGLLAGASAAGRNGNGHHPVPASAKAAEKTEVTSQKPEAAKVPASHEPLWHYLASWRDVFGSLPSDRVTADVAELLRGAPLASFEALCQRKRKYLAGNAQSYAIFKDLAKDCAKAHLYEQRRAETVAAANAVQAGRSRPTDEPVTPELMAEFNKVLAEGTREEIEQFYTRRRKRKGEAHERSP